MINESYEVVYTAEAEQDLRNIYEYIAFHLLNTEAAKNQTNRIVNAIKKLNTMFLRYKLYDKEPWNSMGLRMLSVDNYLVFYQPVHENALVAIIRIMYGSRNIEYELKQ